MTKFEKQFEKVAQNNIKKRQIQKKLMKKKGKHSKNPQSRNQLTYLIGEDLGSFLTDLDAQRTGKP